MGVRIRNLQVDVPDEAHDAAVAFWAAALGGEPRAVDGPYTHLDGVRSRVGVHVQRIEEGPGGYHLDLEADDPDAAAHALLEAGADDLGSAGEWEDGTRLLADPAGLRFCVTRTGQEQHLDDDRSRLHLRVLMVDVPRGGAAATARFWAAAMGGEATPVGERYPAYTMVRPAVGPGGPTNLFVQALDDGGPRLHVDLHCPDPDARDREVARLVDLGAAEVARSHHWAVLRVPGGQHACVVPDVPA